MITPEIKTTVTEALKGRRTNFIGSDSQFAKAIGINPAQYNLIKNGKTDKVLSEANWISLGRQLEVSFKNETPWKTANTEVFLYVTTQLKNCQKKSISGLLCDAADIGKTYAAKAYAKSNKACAYIDCSQYKSKQKLVRAIAKEFGLTHAGKYSEVYGDLVFYLKTIDSPLIVLDEAGDLDYGAFLELKALWNATEGCCGWFMMGADGLKEKIRRSIDNKKVGYTELFSRFGKRFQTCTPLGGEALEDFLMTQAAMIIKANAPAGVDVKKVLGKINGSLRRVKIEIAKM